jgi:hypothetical protein
MILFKNIEENYENDKTNISYLDQILKDLKNEMNFY